MGNMETINIRKAQPEDAALIALLGRITFGEAFRHYFNSPQDLLDYFEMTYSVDHIYHSLKDPNNVFWLATLDDLPVGYAKLIKDSKADFIEEEKAAELEKIYVLRDFLNRKVGHNLQEALFEEVRSIESQSLWLSVFRASTRAIRFYESHGFERSQLFPFVIGQERFQFVAMRKPFN